MWRSQFSEIKLPCWVFSRPKILKIRILKIVPKKQSQMRKSFIQVCKQGNGRHMYSTLHNYGVPFSWHMYQSPWILRTYHPGYTCYAPLWKHSHKWVEALSWMKGKKEALILEVIPLKYLWQFSNHWEYVLTETINRPIARTRWKPLLVY